MKTGLIKLEALYDFVRQHPEVPHRTKDRQIYQAYRFVVLELLAGVPHEAGWYAWFRGSGVPSLVYVGQAHEGKTSSLYSRLREELLEEYVAFWVSVDRHAGDKLFAKYGWKYNQKRCERKRHSDAIIWIASPGAKRGTLDVIENKLIWDLKPPGNDDQRDYSEIQCPGYKEVRALMETVIAKSG